MQLFPRKILEPKVDLCLFELGEGLQVSNSLAFFRCAHSAKPYYFVFIYPKLLVFGLIQITQILSISLVGNGNFLV